MSSSCGQMSPHSIATHCTCTRRLHCGRCICRLAYSSHPCRPDQIKAELKTCLRMLDEVYTTFGLSYKMALSTRPEKRLGDEALWDSAEGALTEAMNETGLEWEVGALLQSAGDPPALEGFCQRPWTRQGCNGSWWACDCQQRLVRSGGAFSECLNKTGLESDMRLGEGCRGAEECPGQKP